MLKRNLVAIAIIVLGLGLTSAFGQDFDHNPRPKSVRKATIKKPTSSKGMREAGSGMATGIKARKTTAKSLCENQTIPWKLRTRRSSGSTAKRQHKP